MKRVYPQTINEVFLAAVDRGLENVALYPTLDGWRSVSAAQLQQRVGSLVRVLKQWGVRRGDKVALLSENRPEWAYTDFAVLALGGVDVPIHTTLTAEHTAFLLKDSGAKMIVVSTAAQLQKVLAVRSRLALEKIVVMDEVADTDTVPMRELLEGEPEPGFEEEARRIGPEHLASIMYTSGTTGRPKGVMLTHGNLASNLHHSLEDFELRPGQSCVSFLPLSHITARHLDYFLYGQGVTVAYCPQIEQLPQVLLETRPTIFVGVPRVYEKARDKVLETVATQAVKRRFYEWALRVGEAHLEAVLVGGVPVSPNWRLAERLVYSRFRAGFGGRVEIFISGGAPLGIDLARWYALMGMRIHEGYGLTETSPVIALNTPSHHKLGTVGRPLRNVEVRMAADGEILVRGPSVFRGYWNLPEDTKNAFEDGWFKTGDVGRLDEDGYLSITDRKKDLLKTSGGKFIAPQPIETALKANLLVAQAAVVGEGRKFASVLISPNFSALEAWVRERGLEAGSHQQLVAHPEVQEEYERLVAELNSRLARFETLKKVLVVADEFSPEGGELTASLKLRRKAVEQKYKQQIDALYAAREPAAT